MEQKRLPSVDLHEFPKESLLNRLTSFEKENVADQERLARVLVLYTGGTIGMVTKNGAYEPQSNCMEEKLRSLPIFHDKELAKKTLSPEDLKHFLALPELSNSTAGNSSRHQTKRNIVYKIHEYSPLLDSSNMTREDWIKIAKCIEADYKNYDGFVVLHGTDTMAYTASALSFMCENLGKPIILTGSQIPIYEVRSDGRDNFLSSLIIAGTYNIPEVLLCFNEKVFRGNRSVKMDSSSFTAFDSPNMPPLVTLEINIHVDWPSVFRSGETEKFHVHTNLCQNVGILRLFPGITSQTVRAFLQPPTQGVVLQTYGAGNAPSNREDIIDLFTEATKWGVLILNITQCSRGYVDPAYATGVALQKAGVIPGCDMTPEAALCKLSYILGKEGWTRDIQTKQLGRNLRGELTVTVKEEISLMDNDLIEGVARVLSLSTGEEVHRLRNALFPSLFCAAAKAGDVAALEKLANSGADVSSPNQDGRTALHVACSMGNLNIVQFLLLHGASVHEKDHRGDTPLIDAVFSKSLPVINLLVQTGAILPWTSIRIGITLCGAVAVDDLDTIKAWHTAGADLNSCDYDYRTPLHIAVSSDRKDIVKYLTRGGARCNLQDVFGLTPLGIAQQLGHTEVIQMMSPGGALPAAMSIGTNSEDNQKNVNGRLVARVKPTE
ncbi:L-asparaginase-like isoform X2 [Littorina saxatilis]|uniref:asparaginase n=1 Tax=Littorina saxatilis TaxID=31220 RepID=A0AAN9GCP5_9CAEN